MFRIPIEGPANTFVDNNSVVLNATVPTSTLKWKHNSIACHRVCEAIATNVIRIAKVSGKKNIADILTKPLPANDLTYLVRKVLYFPSAYKLNESSLNMS